MGKLTAWIEYVFFCHAPHHTIEKADAEGILYLPLWNHEVTTVFYTTYQSDFGEGPAASGLDGAGESGADDQFVDRHLLNAIETLGQPSSVSRLCLSCHDGTVAVNAYGFTPSESKCGNMHLSNNLQGPTLWPLLLY